jgi:hypothetical protein
MFAEFGSVQLQQAIIWLELTLTKISALHLKGFFNLQNSPQLAAGSHVVLEQFVSAVSFFRFQADTP